MPSFLLGVNNGNRWLDDRRLCSWVPEGEIPADPLQDLRVKAGTLSLWWVDDNGVNIDRIVAALACGREPDKYEAMVFPVDALDGLGLRIEKSPGSTPDDTANSQWHRDVVELTACKAAALATAIFFKGDIKIRIKTKVAELVTTGVGNGLIKPEKMNGKWRQAISSARPPQNGKTSE